jgi:hypothetical protein
VRDNVFGKLARWKNRQLSLIGKSVIVSSQLLSIIMFTGTVLSLSASMNQELLRGIYRFVWNGNDKEKRALTYQKLKNGGLGLPSLTARLRSAQAHWVAKLMGEQRPMMKLVVEDGVDWTKQEALSSVKETHGVEGFLGECVTAWYDSLSLLKPGGNTLVWPYIKALHVNKIMKKKLPLLTFRGIENNTVLVVKLNFFEKGQILGSIGDAASTRDVAWQQVAHRSRKQFTDEISNTVKWGPRYNVWDAHADKDTLRGQRAMEIRETYCNKGVLDISSQRQLYWLNLAYVVPKSHPFRCKYDIDWKKVD